jgi:RNA polymerase sigma factor (sigma-70 family)
MTARAEPLLHYLRHLTARSHNDASDAVLLERFVSRRDEMAFAVLLARHGPMVLGVCRRILRDDHHAEDAFQAAFLLLARKASSLSHPETLAAWLYGAAQRLARTAQRSNNRRRQRERKSVAVVPVSAAVNPLDELSARDLLVVLDEEIACLPERYRLPLILCGLEGHSHEEAVRILGWTAGSLKGRLERGRKQLQARLSRRGLAFSGALLTLGVSQSSTASVAGRLTAQTLQAALAFARGECGVISTEVVALAESAVTSMTVAKAKMGLALLLVASLAAGTAALAHHVLSARQPEMPKAIGQSAEPPRAETKQPRTDREGVPLPAGVIARLGTTRFRPMASELVFRDGRTLVTCGPNRVLRFWDVATGTVKKVCSMPGTNSNRVILSHDGQRLALQEEEGMSVWDVDSGKRLRLIQQGVDRVFTHGVFSPDARTLALAEFSGTHAVRLWNLTTGEEKMLGKTSHFLLSMAFSPDGKRLALAVQDRTLVCWDVANGKELWKRPQLPRGMGFSPDGRILAVADPTDPARVRLIDAATGTSLDDYKFPGVRGPFRVRFSPDGKTLAIGTDRGIVIWDLTAAKQCHFLDRASFTFAFAPDGKSLISLGAILQRWDVATGKSLYEDTSRLGHTHVVGKIAWSPDGRQLASVAGGNDSPVYLWSVRKGRLLSALPIQSDGERPGWRFTAFTPEGEYLVSASDRLIRVTDAATTRVVREWPTCDPTRKEEAGWLTNCRLSCDGKTILAITQDLDARQATWLKTWDAATGERRSAQPISLRLPRAAVFSPDGRLLVDTGGVLHDVVTGKVRFRLSAEGEIGDLYGDGIIFSPDGASIAGLVRRSVPNGKKLVRPEAKGIQFWRTDTGKPSMRLAVNEFCSFAFSPDGRFLATAGAESIRLWEIASAKEVFHHPVAGHLLGEHGDPLAFAPDGRSLAIGLRDTTIVVWDVMPAVRDGSQPLSAAQRDRLWADLAGADAAKAYTALGQLIARPAETLPLLRARLRPVAAIPAERVKRLLADLDSSEFERREAAMRQLAELGEGAEPALHEALNGNPPLELRRRIDHLLARMNPKVIDSPETLRGIRAVCVLEQIGNTNARQLLESLAKGTSSARLTCAAKASLRRLSQRPARKP